MPRRMHAKRGQVSRPATRVTRGSRWGNPFTLQAHGGPFTRDECLRLFTSYARMRVVNDPGWLDPLRGQDLACACRLDEPCHADILLRLAN